MKRSAFPIGQVVCTAVFVVLFSGCETAFAQKKGAAKSDDWRALFDGTSLSGWRHLGEGGFKVKDRAMVSEGGAGMLWYSGGKFSNCQIRISFKLSSPRDNSGVFIRIPKPPVDPSDGAKLGYEVEINNTGDAWHRTGCLYGVKRAQSVVLANVNDWNTMIVTLYGPRTRVHVNGVLVTDHVEENRVPVKSKWYEDEQARRPDAGYIGLENHDVRSIVQVKEVSVRPLK